MKFSASTLFALATGTLLFTPLSGCGSKLSHCEERLSCGPGQAGETSTPESSGGQATGGASGGGGSSSSGGHTVGSGGAAGGSGGSAEPCASCGGSKPACEKKQCVACTATDRGACGEEERCSPLNICVECIENGDCKDVSASQCDKKSYTCSGCGENADCEHLAATPVCSVKASECVECTTAEDCEGKVCDPQSNTCTKVEAGEKIQCQECVYDAQCHTGQVCVAMRYSNPSDGAVGSFCLWRKDAPAPGPKGTCGLNSQPYAQEQTVTTVDGEEGVVVCGPRSTCLALQDFNTEGQGCAVQYDDDDACGSAAFNDGLCRDKSTDDPRCTYGCLGPEDCFANTTCKTDSSGSYCGF